jgi:HEAT repeat protein
MITRSTNNPQRGGLVRFAMLIAALAVCREVQAAPARAVRRSMTYDQAVALLQVPERWCEAAAALAKLGDHRAIGPLHRVVARTEEGLPNRGCVHDALTKLGVRDEIVKLVGSTEVTDRRTGIELMKACPDDSHPPILARLALHDPEPDLRSLAAWALRTQKVTAAWDTAMIALLGAGDSDIRRLAATSLEHRFGTPVLTELRKRLGTESRADVRGALEVAIRCHEDHASARR